MEIGTRSPRAGDPLESGAAGMEDDFSPPIVPQPRGGRPVMDQSDDGFAIPVAGPTAVEETIRQASPGLARDLDGDGSDMYSDAGGATASAAGYDDEEAAVSHGRVDEETRRQSEIGKRGAAAALLRKRAEARKARQVKVPAAAAAHGEMDSEAMMDLSGGDVSGATSPRDMSFAPDDSRRTMSVTAGSRPMSMGGPRTMSVSGNARSMSLAGGSQSVRTRKLKDTQLDRTRYGGDAEGKNTRRSVCVDHTTGNLVAINDKAKSQTAPIVGATAPCPICAAATTADTVDGKKKFAKGQLAQELDLVPFPTPESIRDAIQLAAPHADDDESTGGGRNGSPRKNSRSASPGSPRRNMGPGHTQRGGPGGARNSPVAPSPLEVPVAEDDEDGSHRVAADGSDTPSPRSGGRRSTTFASSVQQLQELCDASVSLAYGEDVDPARSKHFLALASELVKMFELHFELADVVPPAQPRQVIQKHVGMITDWAPCVAVHAARYLQRAPDKEDVGALAAGIPVQATGSDQRNVVKALVREAWRDHVFSTVEWKQSADAEAALLQGMRTLRPKKCTYKALALRIAIAVCTSERKDAWLRPPKESVDYAADAHTITSEAIQSEATKQAPAPAATERRIQQIKAFLTQNQSHAEIAGRVHAWCVLAQLKNGGGKSSSSNSRSEHAAVNVPGGAPFGTRGGRRSTVGFSAAQAEAQAAVAKAVKGRADPASLSNAMLPWLKVAAVVDVPFGPGAVLDRSNKRRGLTDRRLTGSAPEELGGSSSCGCVVQ